MLFDIHFKQDTFIERALPFIKITAVKLHGWLGQDKGQGVFLSFSHKPGIFERLWNRPNQGAPIVAETVQGAAKNKVLQFVSVGSYARGEIEDRNKESLSPLI